MNEGQESFLSEPFKQWQCTLCGYLYDEAQGSPEDGIKPGTRWSDIPDSWVCPMCGAAKADFAMIEVG